MKKTIVLFLFLSLPLIFIACAGDKAAQPEDTAATPVAAAEAETVPVQAQNTAEFNKISDFSNAWTGLYNQNEALINAYEGMPIMALVTPQLTFALSVQYDMLNLNNQDGRFEGKLMLAGFPGFVEKKGRLINFGYDDTLEKDGFGPGAKAGDRSVNSGFLDIGAGYYRSEVTTHRDGKMIKRSYCEFKRFADGSMACLDFSGSTLNSRGDAENSDQVIFLHNGPGRYDFVVAKGASGPDFKTINFADNGDITKEKAIELLQAAGYTLEKTGGIQNGKLVVDPALP